MTFVLDTHIVFELLLWNSPKQAWLRTELEAGRAALLTRSDALAELRRVLGYPQLALHPEQQALVLERYQQQAALLPDDPPTLPLPRCRDGDDQKFLEIAWQGGARALLTRDQKLLKIGKHRLYRARFAVCVPEQLQAALARGLTPALGVAPVLRTDSGPQGGARFAD